MRSERRDGPKILKPTDAIIRISAACVCGSDVWPYRGINPVTKPTPMGHEYCGVVEEVGSAVTSGLGWKPRLEMHAKLDGQEVSDTADRTNLVPLVLITERSPDSSATWSANTDMNRIRFGSAIP